MAVISKLNIDGQDITKYNNSTIRNIHLNGVDYHFAKGQTSENGVCENAVNEPIIDMLIGGNSIQSKLPSEYQQVEYISCANQYIDTGYYANQDTKVEMKVLSFYTTNQTFYSSRTNYGVDTFSCFIVNGQIRHDYNTTQSAVNVIASEGMTYNIVQDKNILTVNGINHTIPYATFTSQNTMTLGASKIPSLDVYLIGRIYYCKIYDNEKLVRDYIPCYRKSDNEIGLYDIVEGKFYTNLGTGKFAKGLNSPTPEAPIEVESVGEKTKNFFDKDNAEVLTATFVSTKIAQFEGRAMIYIKCEPNTTYTISKQAGNSFSAAYTVDKPAIGVDQSGFINFTTNSKGTITTDSMAQYLCIVVWGNDTISVKDMLKTVQVELGSTATEYEPYGYKVPIKVGYQIINIYLNEPLRKIGDYADYIDYKNKKVVRNIVSEYIDTVGYVSGDDGTYKKFLSDIETKPLLSGSGTTATGFAISNKFNRSIYNYTDMTHHSNQIQTYITTSGVNRVSYTFNDSSITTIEQAQSLIGDGFEVCYVLATPMEEIIDISEISTNDGTNIFEVETSIEPSEFSIDYWKQI